MVLKFPKNTRILNIDIRIWIWIVIGLFIGLSIKVLFFSTPHFNAVENIVYLEAAGLRLAIDSDLEPEHEGILAQSQRSAPLPATYNLWTQNPNSSRLSKFVLNQGPVGSCTANALSYAWMLYKYKTWDPRTAPIKAPSRLFWYAEARIHLFPNATTLTDCGCYVEDIAWVPVVKGQLPESAYPYSYSTDRYGNLIASAGLVNKNPPKTIDDQALLDCLPANTITKFTYSVNSATTLVNMKRVLSSGKSILLGIYVYASFQSLTALRTGNIPLPNRTREKLLGGHCICLTGYDTTCFTFRNSWGTSVGKEGAFRIPYDYITNPRLSGDAWVL